MFLYRDSLIDKEPNISNILLSFNHLNELTTKMHSLFEKELLILPFYIKKCKKCFKPHG